MGKQYKEIKLFNGMAMNIDANDIPDDNCQLAVNIKDISNGKLESQFKPDFKLKNDVKLTLGETAYNIKEINETVSIINNSGVEHLVMNTTLSNDTSVAVKASIQNEDIKNEPLTNLLTLTSEKTQLVNSGKQIRLSKDKQPYFIGYVKNQGSLHNTQNDLIVETDIISDLQSSDYDFSYVTVMGDLGYVFFADNSNKICFASTADIPDANIKANIIYQSGIVDASASISMIKIDRANNDIYLFALTYTERIYKIIHLTFDGFLDDPEKILENLLDISSFKTKSCTINLEREVSITRKDAYDIADFEITRDYIFISMGLNSEYYYNFDTEMTVDTPIVSGYSFKDRGLSFETHQANALKGDTTKDKQDILYRIDKEFTPNKSYSHSTGLISSMLPYYPTPYIRDNNYSTTNDGFFYPLNYQTHLQLDLATFKIKMIDYLNTAGKDQLMATIPAALPGTQNIYYLYYDLPDTGILRRTGYNGQFREVFTFKNNLVLCHYEKNIVGISMTGCVNGCRYQSRGGGVAYAGQEDWYGSYKKQKPSDYDNTLAHNGIPTNGYLVFKITRTDNDVCTINGGSLNGKERKRIDKYHPTSDTLEDIWENEDYWFKSVENYMLTWNGEVYNDNFIMPPIPFKFPNAVSLNEQIPSIVSFLPKRFFDETTRGLVIFKTSHNEPRVKLIYQQKMSSVSNDANESVGAESGRAILFSTGKEFVLDSNHDGVKTEYWGDTFGSSWYSLCVTNYDIVREINLWWHTTDPESIPIHFYHSCCDDIYKELNLPLYTKLCPMPISGNESNLFSYLYGSKRAVLSILKNSPTIYNFEIKETSKPASYGELFIIEIDSSVENSLFGLSGLSIFFNFSNVSDSDFVYEKGYSYRFRVSLLYDGFQESPLASKTFTTDVLTEDYTDCDFDIRLSSELVNSLSKRITAINLYVAKFVKDTQIELYRLIKEIPITTSYFSVVEHNIYGHSFKDTGSRLGSYEANTGLSELTRMVSIKYECYHVYNNTLYAGNLEEYTAKDFQGEYIVTKSEAGKLSIFDYVNKFIVMPFKPLVITSFNYKLYVFGEDSYAILNPETLAIELKSNAIGCSNHNFVLSTNYGLFVYSNGKIYAIDGVNVKNISQGIERADDKQFIGLEDINVNKLYFDTNRNSMCVLGYIKDIVGYIKDIDRDLANLSASDADITFNYLTAVSDESGDDLYTSSISAVEGYGNSPVLTIPSDVFPAGKPIIFSLSFDTNAWRIDNPIAPLTVDGADYLSPYSVSGTNYLWRLREDGATKIQQSVNQQANKKEFLESVYVSKKLYINSEFLSAFIYKLKLNCYRLYPHTSVKITYYLDNKPVRIDLFETGNEVYDRFIEYDTWDATNFANNQKYNYIVLEIKGVFEDIQSVGMMVRGLIR